MAVAHCYTFALWGLEARPVTVEVDISPTEKAALIIVGLPDSAIKEAKDRVSAALKNSGYPIDNCCCVVNLAPAHLRKEGARYDLAIAVAILQARGILRKDAPLNDYLIAGELSLAGEVRSINGVLPLALLARQQKRLGILVPASNKSEGATVQPLATLGVATLRETVAFLNGHSKITPAINNIDAEAFVAASATVDMRDIRGQEQAKRALEIAAAGNHNLALSGPPGTGKSMLARALIAIMPPLTLEEALEITQIHSVAQMLAHEGDIIRQRPFRAPHHTISYAGLIGGGAVPRPGEVSLAHNGVLFLDELPEFGRPVLEVLRQPLEDHHVTVSRARGNVTFPSRFLCITAMNPCPCGYLGHPTRPCRDTDAQISRYTGKISGPLWDRLDLHIQMSPLSFAEMHSLPAGESSAEIRQRVIAARKRQYHRYGYVQSNGMLSPRDLHKHCNLDIASKTALQNAMERLQLSARAADKLLRVALTIADLEAEPLAYPHIMEALTYRRSD